jgi:hypothetical protein
MGYKIFDDDPAFCSAHFAEIAIERRQPCKMILNGIQIINSHVRLLLFDKVQNKKVAMKSFIVKLQCLLAITDLFGDAFRPIVTVPQTLK